MCKLTCLDCISSSYARVSKNSTNEDHFVAFIFFFVFFLGIRQVWNIMCFMFLQYLTFRCSFYWEVIFYQYMPGGKKRTNVTTILFTNLSYCTIDQRFRIYHLSVPAKEKKNERVKTINKGTSSCGGWSNCRSFIYLFSVR